MLHDNAHAAGLDWGEPDGVHGRGLRQERQAPLVDEAATDLLVDKLERQVERLRDKKVREPRRRVPGTEPEPAPVEEIEQDIRSTNG